MKPNEIDSIKQQNKEKFYPIPMIMVGMGTCGIGNGAESVLPNFKNKSTTKYTLHPKKQDVSASVPKNLWSYSINLKSHYWYTAKSRKRMSHE